MESKEIEKKWQEAWKKSKIFQVEEKGKKFYNLEMFPYPSGSGLHMGHAKNYSIGDVYARFKRLNNYNVLYPMGFDSFGLPAENAAIKANTHPKEYTKNSINNFKNQLESLGLSYDWSREISTSSPEYYQWNQYLFLKFYENKLIKKKKAPINWCESCQTVLANEQVEDGLCWICHNPVEIKSLSQWFLNITKYAPKLLKDIEKLDWPEKIKIMQRNWIGESEGTLVNFNIKDSDEKIKVFTTRPDTLWGVTFMVYAPEHPKVLELIENTEKEKEVKQFINKIVLQEKHERTEKEKEGLFIGKYAINPVNNETIPIYIANFVLPDYGTGCVMAVPAHDQRDFEFAKKYNIPIKIVIQPEHELDPETMAKAYVEEGSIVNSEEQFNGLNNKQAIKEINDYLKENKIGIKTKQYKLRDWLISRQRYWGTPIPLIYCEKCGILPSKIPVLLPDKVEFTHNGNPLKNNQDFVNTKCPKCSGKAKRETDTMDTFFDSSWYFLRFCDPNNKEKPFDPKKAKHWMPVDQYIGGAEHAVLHLLYARFFTKVLKDLKILDFDEPFKKLFVQGIVYKEGAKMSKSKGNVIDPLEMIEKYSADTLRIFLLSGSHPSKTVEWEDKGIEATQKFINKIDNLKDKVNPKTENKNNNLKNKTNILISEVTKNIETFNYNLALINIQEFVTYLYRVREDVSKEIFNKSFQTFLILLSPFAPHISEELYKGDKKFIAIETWPSQGTVDKKLNYVDDFISEVISDIHNVLKLVKIESPKKIILSISPNWKYKLYEDVKKVNSKNLKEIMEYINKKNYDKKESVKIISSLIKKPKIEFVLDEKTEFNSLINEKRFLEKEFKLNIEIEKNGERALPGKPSIKIE